MIIAKCFSMKAVTSNGGIKLDSNSIQQLFVSSANGDLELRYTPKMNGSYTISAANGITIVRMPSDSSFTLNATALNGRITTTGFSFASSTSDGKYLIAVSGDGSARINVLDMNGNINLHGY